MTRARADFVAGALAGLLLGSTSALHPQDPPPPSGVFEERLDVRLVQIELLATDRQGRPVTDLGAEELIVREDGRVQDIALFERHVPNAAGPGTIPQGRIHFRAPDGQRPHEARGRETRWLVFFFDLVHGALETRGEARAAGRDFVATRLAPGDRLAVASFDGSIHLEASFSSDREALLGAIDRAFARPARSIADQARLRELLTLLRSCQKQMVFQQRFRPGQECLAAAGRSYVSEVRGISERFIAAIDSLSRLLAGVQGRKILFLFSHGVALDPGWEAVEAIQAIAGSNEQVRELRYQLTHSHEGDQRRDFSAAVDRAVRSGVTVFSLDGTPMPAGDFGIEERARLRRTARPFTVAFEQARDSLEQLSSSTGGKFFGSGDFSADLDRALEVTHGAYRLGYYRDLSRIEDPEAFFKIKLATTRSGVRISTRKGYHLGPISRATRLGRLELAAPEVRDPTTLVPFSLTVHPLAFDLTRDEREVGMQLTLHLVLRTAGGAPVADSFHFLSHRFARSIWEGGKVLAPRYEGFLELAPGDYLFSALLRDPRGDTYSELGEEIRIAGSPAR